MKRIVLILWVLILLSNCDPNNQKLRIINNSNEVIYYRLLTDTVLWEELYIYELAPHDTTYPNFVMGDGQGVWEYKINSKSIDSSLYIYVFKSHELTDSIILNQEYERYNFTVKELDKFEWIFEYHIPLNTLPNNR